MDQSPPHSSYTSIPILAISILGILTTAILLLSYYIFVIKCCLNWRRSDLLLFRFSHSRHQFTPQILRHANEEARGLDSSTINSIPTSRFVPTTNTTLECAVCLIDFQEQELLRLLPNCKHLFHIDCIDTWLQSNPNCPLCRAGISLLPIPQLSSSTSNSGSPLREEDSSVVIQVRDSRRFRHANSKGDECIDMREKDERFVVQPIRRSFSMDSSNDRGLYASVQEILRHNTNFAAEGSSNGGGGGGRIRRSLFSFGRSSRNASVLPVRSEFL